MRMISMLAERAMSRSGASSFSSAWVTAGSSAVPRVYDKQHASRSAKSAGLVEDRERVPGHGWHAARPALRQPFLARTPAAALWRTAGPLQAGGAGGAHAALPGGGGHARLVFPGLLVPGAGHGRG